jgi:hypothetical protein
MIGRISWKLRKGSPEFQGTAAWLRMVCGIDANRAPLRQICFASAGKPFGLAQDSGRELKTTAVSPQLPVLNESIQAANVARQAKGKAG